MRQCLPAAAGRAKVACIGGRPLARVAWRRFQCQSTVAAHSLFRHQGQHAGSFCRSQLVTTILCVVQTTRNVLHHRRHASSISVNSRGCQGYALMRPLDGVLALLLRARRRLLSSPASECRDRTGPPVIHSCRRASTGRRWGPSRAAVVSIVTRGRAHRSSLAVIRRTLIMCASRLCRGT